jgi:rhodanese-related sulfurtransferase
MGLWTRLFGSGQQHVTTDELRAMQPRPIIVEALSEANFAKGHLPGAINMPRAKVRELAPKLIPDLGAQIVTYCKGPT